MTTAKTTLYLATLLFSVSAAAGCGDDNNGLPEFEGSATSNYTLNYDKVRIQRQESGGKTIALIVLFSRGEGVGETPLKIVANAPVSQGVKKSLAGDGGAALHVVASGAQFPALVKPSTITFDKLGEIATPASGKFALSFVGGDTLSGKFSGTLANP